MKPKIGLAGVAGVQAVAHSEIGQNRRFSGIPAVSPGRISHGEAMKSRRTTHRPFSP